MVDEFVWLKTKAAAILALAPVEEAGHDPALDPDPEAVPGPGPAPETSPEAAASHMMKRRRTVTTGPKADPSPGQPAP